MKKKNRLCKGLSLMLVILMIITSMPLGIFAVDDKGENDSFAKSDEVQLDKDKNVNVESANKNLTQSNNGVTKEEVKKEKTSKNTDKQSSSKKETKVKALEEKGSENLQCVNPDRDKAKIQIHKTVTGLTKTQMRNLNLTFTLVSKDGSYLKVISVRDGQWEGNNGNSWHSNAITVDEGEYYIKSEGGQNISGYDVKTDLGNSVVAKDNTIRPINVKNHYTKEKESKKIFIKKTVNGLTSEEINNLNITFTLKGSNNFTKDITLSEGTWNGNVWTSNEIYVNPGQYYVADENGAEVSGYTLTKDLGGKVCLVNCGNESQTININNNYTKLKTNGYITIKKIVSGLTNDEISNLNLRFTLKGDNGYEKIVSLSDGVWEDNVWSSNKIEVPEGSYNVTKEDGGNVTGYTLNTVFSDKQVVTKDLNKTIEIKNDYTLNKVKLRITKTVSGLTREEINNLNITFTLKGSNNFTKDIALSEGTWNGNVWTSNEIYVNPGQYYVSNENGAEVNGYTLNKDMGSEITIPVGESEVKEISVKNDYTLNKVKLRITKTVLGLSEDMLSHLNITFKLVGSNGYTHDVSLSDGIWDGITWTSNEIYVNPGSYYIVGEEGAEVEGYMLSVTLGDIISIEKGDTNTKTINVTNSYTEVKGDEEGVSFDINKVDSNGNAVSGAEFSIYKLENNKEVFVSKTKGSGSSFTFENLMSGEYRVYETKVPKGYTGLDGYFEVSINDDGNIYLNDKKLKEDESINVINTNDGTTPEVIGQELGPKENKKTDNPKTGDNSMLGGSLLLFALGGLGLISSSIYIKKRKSL